MHSKQLLAAALLTLYLGISNGRLALIRYPESECVKIYPLTVQMLPLCDQIKLREGIPIRNNLHLQQLLEDYLS